MVVQVVVMIVGEEEEELASHWLLAVETADWRPGG
jgi:hypothetical protein